MITGYDVQNINNEKVLILYLNYDSEFGIDFRLHHKINNMKKEIKKFIKEKNIKFNGEKIALSFGGIILAVLLLIENPATVDDFNLTYVSSNIVPNEIVAVVEPNIKEEIKEVVETKDEIISEDEEKEEVNNDSEIDKVDSNDSNNSQDNNLNSEVVKDNNIPTDTSKQENSNLNTQKSSGNIISKEEASITQQVTVYRTNGTTITLSLDEYLIGVVGAEMPASFSIEALKAQAVVARTYALKKLENGERLTDSVSTQSYKDNSELQKQWGSSYNTYYQKIKNAVESTKGLAIYYQGNLIDAVYHSTSNGKTEDSVYVWGNDIPYLKSVNSSWDKDATTYLRETSNDFNNVLNLLGIDIREDINFETLSRNASGRVLEIKVGDQTFSGVEFRTLLGLRSADFDLSLENGFLNITTKGYGHGVGMSQYGANGMAKQGYTYEQILKHYYTGVDINKKI